MEEIGFGVGDVDGRMVSLEGASKSAQVDVLSDHSQCHSIT